jgi:hypothetical protein
MCSAKNGEKIGVFVQNWFLRKRSFFRRKLAKIAENIDRWDRCHMILKLFLAKI